MKVAVTGADGFLGWHLQVRAKALRPDLEIVPVAQADWPRLGELVQSSSVEYLEELASTPRPDGSFQRTTRGESRPWSREAAIPSRPWTRTGVPPLDWSRVHVGSDEISTRILRP